MIRRILLPIVTIASFALLGACGGDNGLTVRGSVQADTGDARTGFSFPEDVRIDEAEASGEGRITGLCEMRQMRRVDGEDVWGVIVELHRGGTVDDLGLASLTVMQRTDATPDEGRVEAELGTTLYTSDASGRCSVEIPYAVRDSGMVGLTADCDVQDADGNPATVALELDLVGCTVAD
jgi:hypothetical protein